MTTQAPRKSKDTGDVITDEWNNVADSFSKKWKNFTLRFSNANNWQGLMLDERVGPKIVTKYPVGAILAVLNPDPGNDYNKKWKGTPQQENEIKEIFSKLNTDEKGKLNTMLQETWGTYVAAQGKSINYDKLKKGNFKTMIDSINVQYGWVSTVYGRPAYWFGERENRMALTEFTKHPKEW